MRKRIAVLTHFYAPEPCAAAHRAASLVKALVNEGHDVTVITTFASFPSGLLSAADAARLLQTEVRDGARIVRLFTRSFRGWPGGRILHWLLASLGASAFLLAGRDSFDSIVVTMPPITLAMPALLGAWRHRAKLAVDVRDVYPDIAVAMGEWAPNGLLTRAAEYVARRLYGRANLITAVTPTALAQIASRGVGPDRLLLAPNGFDMVSELAAARARDGGRFTALYAGNLGLATDVDVILDAAAMLLTDGRIAISIAGDGVEGERVRRRVAAEGLSNVRLLGSVPRSEAMRLMADADVVLVPLRKGIKESIPTKIFDALSIGSPVLVAADGEARKTALSSGGGMAVDPGDAAALANALRGLASLDADALRRRGAQGRAFVERFYRREAIMADYSRRIAAL